VNLANEQGGTPLTYAAQEGFLATVECLVTELGADVNQANAVDSCTPLIVVAQYDRLDVLDFLLKANADVNQLDTDGNSPLYWAAQLGFLSVVRALLKHGADVNQA
jgi:ankyrin repeat protein